MADAQEFTLRSVALSAYGPTILFSAASGGMIPLVAIAAHQSGASLGFAAFMLTFYSLGSILMSIPASVITARFGERAALVGSGLVSAAGMSITGLTTSLWALCVGVFAAGLGTSVFGIARQSFLTLVAPPHMRARALSTLGGSARIGTFLGPFIMAFLMGFMSLRGAFLATALMAALAALLCLAVPDDEALAARYGRTPAHDDAGAPSAHAAPRLTVREVWSMRRGTLLTIGMGSIMLAAVRQTKYSIVPLWATHLGVDPQGAAMIVGLSSAADMLLFYPAGRFMDLKGRWLMGVGCLGGLGLTILAMSFTVLPWQLLIAAIAMGLANGLGSGIAMTLAADIAPPDGRPQFLGLWRFQQEIGGLLGPAGFALVTDLVSLAAGLWWTAGLAAIGVVLFLRFLPHRPGPVPAMELRQSARV
jgi:MFS family permease